MLKTGNNGADRVSVKAVEDDELPPRPIRKPKERRRWFNDYIHRPLKETVYDKYICEYLLRQTPLPPSTNGRRIPLQPSEVRNLVDERRGHRYLSNHIRSSRYTLWDFVPKQIIFQVTRIHSLFFWAVGACQMIPGYATTGNFTTLLPLIAFTILTIAKEGFDDYRRHRMDEVENNTYATVLRETRPTSRTKASWKRIAHAASDFFDRIPVLNRIMVKRPKPRYERDTEGRDDWGWENVKYHDIRVGDCLKIRRDDPVPADIVLLSASGEDGFAYVETMALDGETNLKSKQAPKPLRTCSDISSILACNAELVVEDPNKDLYSFNGSVQCQGVSYPLSLNEIVMRGSVIRNSDAIGITVFSGEECKIRMNANHHPEAKKPGLEIVASKVLLMLVLYVVMLAVGCSIGYRNWRDNYERPKAWYLIDANVPFDQIVIGFIIMYNNIIPLALFIALEIVRIGQMLMISGDREMYDEATNTPMTCNTNTIIENLGQVSYLLTDKTGTLTDNIMKFKGLSVAGTSWLHPVTDETAQDNRESQHGKHCDAATGPQSDTLGKVGPEQSVLADGVVVQEYELSESVTPAESRLSGMHERPSFSGRSTDWRHGVQPQLTTPELLEYIRQHPHTSFSQKVRKFILGVALCHTAIPETKSDGHIDFQASSPDEVALVRAAQDLGLLVVSRSAQSIMLRECDHESNENDSVYEILDVIEFSSKRKRMSIIVRCPNGNIWLLCKGADSIIIPRLKQANLAARKSHEVRRSIQIERDLQRKSEQNAPRTSIGGRVSLSFPRQSLDIRPAPSRLDIPRLSRSEKPTRLSADARSTQRSKFAFLEDPDINDNAAIFERCFKHLNDFASDGLRTLVFAQKELVEEDYVAWKEDYQAARTALANRQDRIEAAGDAIEHGFDLLGASAIEDKLQRGVPETIEKLRRAGISIFVLTGDKRETAINIAHSARICVPTSEVFILDSAKGLIERQLQDLANDLESHTFHKVVVIDGDTLGEVEADPALFDLFTSLIRLIDSVICCRASPAQKANIVKAIRARMSGLTLAIGDGANDIAMITAAHVGIGISGREGLQAARVADFSIAQFSFLQRLLLVHGRWNYVRTSKYILWTYWKEIFFYQMQVQVQTVLGFTGSSLFENWSLTVLNTLFTALCTIVPGIFEQDLRAETLLAVPELYEYGQRNRAFNLPQFGVWAVYGTGQGLLCWYLVEHLYARNHATGDGGMYAIGHLCFSLGIMWTNLKLLVLDTNNKDIIVGISFFITTTGWWAWSAFLSGIYSDNLSPFDVKGGFQFGFGRDPIWWLTLIVTLAVLTAVELIYKCVRRHLTLGGRWPPWKKGSWMRNGTVNEWDLILWQELEKDPIMRERFRREAAVARGEAIEEKPTL